MITALSRHLPKGALWRLPHIPAVLKLPFSKSETAAREIYEKILTSHTQNFRSVNWGLNEAEMASAFSDLIWNVYLKKKIPEHIQGLLNFSGLSILEPNGSMSRMWMDIIQRECGINIIEPALLKIKMQTYDNQQFGAHIHNIHKTTYRILDKTQQPYSLRNIYRGVVDSDAIYFEEQDMNKCEIGHEEGVSDAYQINMRCFSLKAHACENYDFDYRRNITFFTAKGMKEIQYNQNEQIVPTVLFTPQRLTKGRYDFIDEEIIWINGQALKEFFYLFELELEYL